MTRLLAGALAAGLLLAMAPPMTDGAEAQRRAEQALPPSVQHALAALRVFKSMSARNRVYREARSVQRDLRAYYDTRIEKAQRQLLDRQQVGLRSSQVQAYQRVVARLEAEREAALALTEDEKRTAKLGFESRLRAQILPVLANTRRARQAIQRVKEATAEISATLQQVREAADLRAALADAQRRIARLEHLAELAEIVPGDLARRLRSLAEAAQRAVDEAGAGVDAAADAATELMARLDGVLDDLDEATTRRPVTDRDVLDRALDALLDRIHPPDGPGGESMRDRVRRALLRETLERIADRCGRLTGALRRAAVDAALIDDDLPEPQAPCPLLGDRPVDDVAGAPSEVDEPWDPEAGLVQILPDGVYPGRFELGDGNPTFGHEVLRAEVRMEVVGGVYTLHVDVEFTMRGPGSPPCHNTHRITYAGVSADDDRRGIPAEFRGPSSHTVTDPGCRTATPAERDDFLTNVWVHEGPTALRGTFDGRAFVLDPPS